MTVRGPGSGLCSVCKRVLFREGKKRLDELAHVPDRNRTIPEAADSVGIQRVGAYPMDFGGDVGGWGGRAAKVE